VSNEQSPVSVAYARDGYSFRIEVRFLPYPWARFQYWAKVTGATRDATGAALTGDQLPFRPVQYHGATEVDVVEQARRQIDDWFDAHPDAGPTV
jgi:hypothetical protein